MIQKAKLYITALLAILSGAKELVDLFEMPKNGPAKKEAVQRGLHILVDVADDVFSWLPEEKIKGMIDKAVELWVWFRKITGSWPETTAEKVVKN